MSRFFRPEVEALPPGDLRALQAQHLCDGLLAAAARSVLYRDRWRTAGVDPSRITTLEALGRLPFITGADLRAAWNHPTGEVLVHSDVRLWFATSGTTGAPKWTPYSRAELAMFEDVVLRAYHMLAADRGTFRCAIIGTPAPFVSDAAAYALLAASVGARLPVEYVIASPQEAERALGLLAIRRPTAIVGFPSLLMRIAEGVTADAPHQARAMWRDQPSLRTLAAMLATRVMRIQARHIFRPQIGLFAGEALAPYRQALRDAWGLQPLELYALTEFPCFHVECPEQSGIHVWSDWCIPEVIPQEALDREERDGTVPQAVHLFDAPEGTVGEFVFTSFARALPLIRYRTSDLITVVGTGRCGCGRTHPRIRVRGRRDDLVNLGLIRFSAAELDRRLGALSGIVSWQLRIGRAGYKPLPVLLIIPASGAEGLVERAADALRDIDVLRLGIDNGLVAPPEVRVVAEISGRTWSGKHRRVIQEVDA